MHRFTLSAWDEENLDKGAIRTLITEHEAHVARLRKNKDYYEGHHAIAKDKKDLRVICNHAKDISDTATGYFMGNPVTYSNSMAEGEKDQKVMDQLLQAFDAAGVNDTDTELALDASVYGVAYEYVYAREGSTDPISKAISPEHTFLVVDDSIEERELCGVYYWRKEDSAKKTYRYVALVTTEHYTYTLSLDGQAVEGNRQESRVEHLFGEPQIIEYRNNKDGIGDFEQQISLMDAYDALISDRITDKEQFIDAILILYGALLGDDDDETADAQKKLKRDKLLELPPDARAEYLTRQMDESGAEVLRKAIKEDIYNFSHVPNFMDENFAGNTSGVAMEYKLLGLEMMTKVKEKYYKQGLRKRIRLFTNQLGMEPLHAQAGSILITFSRGLPKNLTELAQIVSTLSGHVSERTLLQQLPFVEDPQMELEEAAKQRQQQADQQRAMFGMFPNAPREAAAQEE